jgi:hypothetical protein
MWLRPLASMIIPSPGPPFRSEKTGFIENANFSDSGGNLATVTGSANWTFDTATISMQNSGGGLNDYDVKIEHLDMLTITSGTEKLPDGTTYPVQIGK